MATYTASAAQPGVQPKGLSVGLAGTSVVYDHTTISLSINTNVNLIKVPARSRVLFMQYGFTGTGDAVWQIGDSVSGTRHKSAGTLSAGMGMVVASTFGYQAYVYSADDVIVARASLSSATTLGGEFHAVVILGMD